MAGCGGVEGLALHRREPQVGAEQPSPLSAVLRAEAGAAEPAVGIGPAEFGTVGSPGFCDAPGQQAAGQHRPALGVGEQGGVQPESAGVVAVHQVRCGQGDGQVDAVEGTVGGVHAPAPSAAAVGPAVGVAVSAGGADQWGR